MTSRNDRAVGKSCFVRVLIIFFLPCRQACRALAAPLNASQSGGKHRLGTMFAERSESGDCQL